MCVRKLPETRERNTWKEQKGQFLGLMEGQNEFVSVPDRKSILCGVLSGWFLPQWWGKISPRLKASLVPSDNVINKT